MIVTPEIMAFARGFADGRMGRDSPPYSLIDEKELAAIYERGRIVAETGG